VNHYDNAVITVKKYERYGDTIYAELRNENGELLISATLEYIVEALKEHMTKVEEK
jgi:hypothetical protein